MLLAAAALTAAPIAAPIARAQTTAPQPDVATLEDALIRSDTLPPDRAAAAAQLAALRNDVAEIAMISALTSGNPEVETAAAHAIADANWSDNKFIGPLEDLL